MMETHLVKRQDAKRSNDVSSRATSAPLSLKPGLYFERKSTPYMQTILRTCGAFSRPPMPIYAVGIAQIPSV